VEWGDEEIPQRPNNRASPQVLDHVSKMEGVVPKMSRQRGSDTGQCERGELDPVIDVAARRKLFSLYPA